jgi:hypothetical protein
MTGSSADICQAWEMQMGKQPMVLRLRGRTFKIQFWGGKEDEMQFTGLRKLRSGKNEIQII